MGARLEVVLAALPERVGVLLLRVLCVPPEARRAIRRAR